MKYQVIVGNIGTVLVTEDVAAATKCFQDYSLDSMNDYGRAAGQSVTLMSDGEPLRHHCGTIESQDCDGVDESAICTATHPTWPNVRCSLYGNVAHPNHHDVKTGAMWKANR